eukprot:249736-Amphidinium_carterae.1
MKYHDSESVAFCGLLGFGFVYREQLWDHVSTRSPWQAPCSACITLYLAILTAAFARKPGLDPLFTASVAASILSITRSQCTAVHILKSKGHTVDQVNLQQEKLSCTPHFSPLLFTSLDALSGASLYQPFLTAICWHKDGDKASLLRT